MEPAAYLLLPSEQDTAFTLFIKAYHLAQGSTVIVDKPLVSNGLDLSMTRQYLIEESILGWEELEVEVDRDSKKQNLGVPATSGGRAIRGYALSRSIAPLRLRNTVASESR